MKRLVCVLLALVPCLVFAQETPPAKAEKKAAPLEDIERGFFFAGRGGFFGVINPPGVGSAFSAGQAVGVEAGFDIGERLEIALFFLGSLNRMSSSYTGLSQTGSLVSGDFGAFTPGLDVKVRIVGFDDSQEVKRTWIYARAGAGVSFYAPAELIRQFDVFVTGGVGVEYYTQLRHLIIGLEADFNFFALTQAFGFAVYPTVKYAF